MGEAIESAVPALQQPPGATGMSEGSDGQMYFHDAAGKQLGLAPQNIQDDQSDDTTPPAKPAFDPSAPVQNAPVRTSAAKPAFNPSAPVDSAKPAFNPSAPVQNTPKSPAPYDPLAGASQATGIGPQKADVDHGMGSVALWLDDLKNDVKNGTASTKIGALLQKMGAKGTNSGNSEQIGDMMAGPVLGAISLAHANTQTATHPIRALNERVAGVGQILSPLTVTQPEAIPFIVAATAGQKTATAVAQHLGADDDTAEMVGNVAGLIAGGRAVHMGPENIKGFTEAVDNRLAAGKVLDARQREIGVAQQQAADAQTKAQTAVQAEAAGTGTREQTIAAQDNASEAAKNATRAQDALKIASDNQAKAAVAVQQLGKKVVKAGLPKVEKIASPDKVTASNADLTAAIPSGPGASAYSPEDMNVARPYLENYHRNVAPVDSPEAVYDALDHTQQGMENQLKPWVDKYANEPLQLEDAQGTPVSVKQRLVEALADDEKLRPGFTDAALEELDKKNFTTDPSIAEADALRKTLNTDNRAQMARDRSAVNTLRETDPAFAARYELNNILRDGIYGRLEERGLVNARQMRLAESAIIRVRNAADRQIPKTDIVQRGSGEATAARKIGAAVIKKGGVAIGATGGAALAGTEGAALGGWLGQQAGERLGRMLSPEDVTRGQRVARAMKVRATDGSVLQLGTDNALPSNPSSFELPPEVESPINSRENTQIHADLASHYGESLGETPYNDLEKQFMDDVATKKKYNVPLEPAEKTLLAKLNAAKVNEIIEGRKTASQKTAAPAATPAPAVGTANDRPQVTYKPSEKATTMSGPAKDLGKEWNAGAEAHETERNKSILRNPDATPQDKEIAQQRLDEQRQRSLDIARELSEALRQAPPDTSLSAELSSHYNERVGTTPANELEDRFFGDVQQKNQNGVPLEPAEKTLLAKINKSKADTINAWQEASETAAKEKIAAGQNPNTAPPFDPVDHLPLPKGPTDAGITGAMVTAHELGHHFMVDHYGHIVNDMRSHMHPDTNPGALGDARFSAPKLYDADGVLNLKPESLNQILDILHGGPIAQELTTGTSMEKSIGAGSDLAQMKKFLDMAGFDPIESARLMKASEMRTRQILSSEGVPDILKRYSEFRERGLDNKYLMSPEAIGSAIEEFKSAKGGGNATTDNNGPAGRKAPKTSEGNESGGASKVPSGRSKEGGASGEAGTGSRGTGERRGGGVKPPENSAEMKISHGGIESTPPPERTTGNPDYDTAIKAGGGVPGGVTDFKEFGKVINFHDPKTGSTLGIKEGTRPITAENVRDQIAAKHAEYGLPPEMSAEMAGSKTPMSDAILRDNPVSDDPSQSGFIFPKGEHVALRPGEEHESMISKAMNYGSDIPNYAQREAIIQNEGAVRVRARKGRGGDELAYSVPSTGVTEEQLQKMRQGVARQGRYGNVVMETGAGKSIPTQEFAMPSHVDRMLTDLGAHPEQQQLSAQMAASPEELARQRENTADFNRTPEERRALNLQKMGQGMADAFDNPTNRPANVADLANDFNRRAGRQPVNATPIDHSPETAQRIAKAFDAMVHDPENPAVKKSYDAAKEDINQQWGFARDRMGIKFEPWDKPGQPYANSKEMTADVANNKHLYFFRGGEMPADHPLAQIDPETGLTYNDKLRAVHDLYGHAAHGNQFGPKGEENAWNVHRQMFSPDAIPALTAETRGQNSWVNYGDHLRNAEGNLPAKGEPGYIAPPDRPFAQQKAGNLPDEFNRLATPQLSAEFNDRFTPKLESGQTEGTNDARKQDEFKKTLTADVPTMLDRARKSYGENAVHPNSEPESDYNADDQAWITPDGKTKVDVGEDRDHGVVSQEIMHESPEMNKVLESDARAGAYSKMMDDGWIRKSAHNNYSTRELTPTAIDAIEKSVIATGGYGKHLYIDVDKEVPKPYLAAGNRVNVSPSLQSTSLEIPDGWTDLNKALRTAQAKMRQPVELGAEMSSTPEQNQADKDKGLISTRLPAGKNATEDPMENVLRVDRDAINNAKGMPEKVAAKIRKMSDVKIPENLKDPQKIMDRFVQHVSTNLKKVYGQVDPDTVANTKQWYESANKLAGDLSDKHGITPNQAAGTIAAMSPQKDWDMNVSLAQRLNDIYHNHADEPATPEMMAKGQQLATQTNSKGDLTNEKLGPLLSKIEGKKLSELQNPLEKAAWTRLYDEAHNPREYGHIDPATGQSTGNVQAKNGPAKVAWGSLNQIGNAISILDDGSRQNISDHLGGSHKVRNFYNNIVDPDNPAGHVTIDTHAVAAGHMRPMSGKSPEVAQNFGQISSKATGMKGLYPLYAEAYRTAAADLGLQPRQLQSVVWEKIREMFPAEQKTAANVSAIDKMWKDYGSGKQTLDNTHKNVLDYAKDKMQAQPSEGTAGTRLSAMDFVKALDMLKERSAMSKLGGQ